MTNIFELLKSRKSLVQLFHYGLIGLSSNLIGYLIYLLITYLGGTPKATMTVLYGVGALIGFFGNKKLTFTHDGNMTSSIFRYFIAHVIGYLLNFSILFLMVDMLGYAHQIVQVIAIFSVAIVLFVLFKFYVFSESTMIRKLDI